MSANVIVQGPRDVLDLRKQLLKGCVECGNRISEFMLSQDIACALTAGYYELKSESNKLLQEIWNNKISLSDASEKTEGLVRASGETALVLKTLKEVDLKKFLEVLCILWRHEKEKKFGGANTLQKSKKSGD